MTVTTTGFGVHLKVADIEASRAFYEGYLGLPPTFAYGNPDFLATIPSGVATAPERYRGVTYTIEGGALIEIAEGHIAVQDDRVFKDPITTPKVSAMLRVRSFVPLLEKSDRRPSFPVCHYYWGSLEMVVRDPDGWVIVLIAEYSDAEREAVERFLPVEDITPG